MLEPRYNPQATEAEIYRRWEESGYFNPDKLPRTGTDNTRTHADSPTAEPSKSSTFSIVLPPPNVTGTLHMGHAAMLAIEDILVRFQRMRGARTLWVPGTDHAAIATQAKVEKIIAETEGKNKYDLGRAEFLKRVDEFAKHSHDTIVNQIKRMGASVDWSREAFTLDAPRTLAVRTAFARMYAAGLIYRGYRVVNWDPKGQTVISDDETFHEERKAKLYTFKYSPDFPISIATTRPETKLGDTAVAVHPADPRYAAYVGREYDVVFCGEFLHIKIVADEAVDKDFATGAVGVTPAHSQTDWEIAQRHNLPMQPVINEQGRIMANNPDIAGKKTPEAREIIIQWLRDSNLLEKEEEVAQNVATAERTGGIIEPLPKLQWFVGVNKKFVLLHSAIKGIESGGETTLKETMRAAVSGGQIKIVPERFANTYFNWIDNLRDWCISRQIWYGHRVPVWYCKENQKSKVKSQKCGEPIVSITDVAACPECGGETEQDPDTLDTWFSSGLWTFSTLGWPKETPDMQTYHPTTVLETGYDIIFFWVARMILMSGYLLGEVPFRTVYLHGLVRDARGRKMSKSLGNTIDPLEMIEKYGADATRLSLVIGNAPGSDNNLSEDKVRGYRNFATKIWNTARFVLMRRPANQPAHAALSPQDKRILQEFRALANEVTARMEAFEFHLAAEKLYHYLWHIFADKIIEDAKPRLRGENIADAQAVYALLEIVLLQCLTLLHPFAPFVTEAVYGKFRPGEMLMVKQWPTRQQ